VSIELGIEDEPGNLASPAKRRLSKRRFSIVHLNDEGLWHLTHCQMGTIGVYLHGMTIFFAASLTAFLPMECMYFTSVIHRSGAADIIIDRLFSSAPLVLLVAGSSAMISRVLVLFLILIEVSIASYRILVPIEAIRNSNIPLEQLKHPVLPDNTAVQVGPDHTW
jgi:hypothetical protein